MDLGELSSSMRITLGVAIAKENTIIFQGDMKVVSATITANNAKLTIGSKYGESGLFWPCARKAPFVAWNK